MLHVFSLLLSGFQAMTGHLYSDVLGFSINSRFKKLANCLATLSSVPVKRLTSY